MKIELRKPPKWASWGLGGCDGGGGGGSSGSFRRTGTGIHAREYSVPDNISSLITNAASAANVDPGLAAKQTQLFNNLMDGAMDATASPGYAEVAQFADMNPLDYSGRDALYGATKRDPYSGAYARDTLDRYHLDAQDALAQVASGPSAVRGADARTGLMQGQLSERLSAGRGQELRSAQLQDLASVLSAAKGMNDVETGRLGMALQSALGLSGIANSVGDRGLKAGQAVDMSKLQNLNVLQLAAQLQGKTLDTQTDDFSGKGDQGGWQAGVSCCFIFLEALNGKLPWYIELARFDYLTPWRRSGYKWMAGWLVPLMRKSKLVVWFVNALIVRPFLRYGGWLYGENNSLAARALAPYCHMWLGLWAAIGKYGRRLS